MSLTNTEQIRLYDSRMGSFFRLKCQEYDYHGFSNFHFYFLQRETKPSDI